MAQVQLLKQSQNENQRGNISRPRSPSEQLSCFVLFVWTSDPTYKIPLQNSYAYLQVFLSLIQFGIYQIAWNGISLLLLGYLFWEKEYQSRSNLALFSYVLNETSFAICKSRNNHFCFTGIKNTFPFVLLHLLLLMLMNSFLFLRIK